MNTETNELLIKLIALAETQKKQTKDAKLKIKYEKEITYLRGYLDGYNKLNINIYKYS